MNRLIEVPCEKEERKGKTEYILMREENGRAYCDIKCDHLGCQYKRGLT
jgi:hypothetical protein